jgi:hypothetical protein
MEILHGGPRGNMLQAFYEKKFEFLKKKNNSPCGIRDRIGDMKVSCWLTRAVRDNWLDKGKG